MEDLQSILSKSNNLSDLARYIFNNENYTNREKCKKILEENNINWKQWLKTKEKHNYCLQCGNEILGRDRLRKKFCNASCAAKYNNVHREKRFNLCLNCQKKINHLKKFCDNHCKQEFYYKKYIERWKANLETGISGEGCISDRIRRYLLEKYNYTCQNIHCNCNWKNPYTGNSILQIHHIDGDCTNNREENLQLLCPNCHAMTANHGSRNKNSTRIDRRTKYYRNINNIN